MTQPALLPEARKLVVLSASRRTDLVGCYPDELARQLQKYPPDHVHTIVIWTKNPAAMLEAGALRDSLSRYSQLYVHLTVTGLGASVLEPRIPTWKTVAGMLPGLIALVRGPERVCWRFDPIIGCETAGGTIANIDLFDTLARPMAEAGIAHCTTSWVEPYRKVLRRMEKSGLRLLPYTQEERDAQARQLAEKAAARGMQLSWCCVAGQPGSRCIDGSLLNRLHPEGWQCSTKRAKGQRKLCGCTESIDIGWYSQKCGHGCLYCYAEPQVENV